MGTWTMSAPTMIVQFWEGAMLRDRCYPSTYYAAMEHMRTGFDLHAKVDRITLHPLRDVREILAATVTRTRSAHDALAAKHRALRGHAFGRHASRCPLRVAAECAGAIQCDHGFDVCPQCDACTCGMLP
jgi:hypothetical protein